MLQRVMVEKRDAEGRLLAVVGMADGLLDGPCRFYAPDGETLVAETLYRAGVPVAADPPRVLTNDPALSGGDSAF